MAIYKYKIKNLKSFKAVSDADYCMIQEKLKRNIRHLLLTVLLLAGTLPLVAQPTPITDVAGLNAMAANGNYIITADIDATNYTPTLGNTAFTGTLTVQAFSSGDRKGEFPVISGLTRPLFITATGATISNIMLKNVRISPTGLVGAIACTANGATKIYNCGILPTTPKHLPRTDEQPNIRSTVGSTNSKNCGSLVGKLDGTARVINCFSYADITGGSTVGGLVGNNAQTSNQDDIKTIVVNCMFYGDIKNCTSYAPVYGNKAIENNPKNIESKGINPYCFFSAKDGTFADASFSTYNRTWPADYEYLTRFEYYRSILNSNRQLCTYWVTDHDGLTQTAADTALIAKWVLDPSIAPYPILKKWGKYPSIVNPDPTRTWDPEANNGAGAWQTRSSADPYRGKSHGTLSVTVMPGGHAATAVQTAYGTNGKSITLTITEMDTLNHDYGYYKVQLPYYNELFGNPANTTDHDVRYGGNYKDYVVTGWMVSNVQGSSSITYNNFSTTGDTPYNYADRKCIDKDLFATTGRVFAQGGYYYVPEGVTEITITAKWGKAVYLRNAGNYIDRVNITNSSNASSGTVGSPFTLAGTLPTTTWFTGQVIKDDWREAVKALDAATKTGDVLSLSVYDQAIVLIGNLQLKNQNAKVGYNIDSNWHPYTIMSIDQDLDNEPDYCFELQFRDGYNRDGIQPIRFDFLPVPELGLAVRHDNNFNTIGIFVPQGHFEITETSFMHTTQFEYDGDKSISNNPKLYALSNNGGKLPAPIILNGGHFEQIVVRYRYQESGANPYNNTQYFLMGGHFRMLRFTPGAHPNANSSNKTVVRLCPVNCIGGEYPEFYLSGIYNHNVNPTLAVQGHPKCYTNGGRFNLMAGAGYEKVMGNVTFKIDHSFIKEFYGGGINAAKPVGGNIDVTIDHSLVGKYCGGPKVGSMEYTEGGVTKYKTVTTNATGTTFGQYYGGGNGGTSYYREQGYDGNDATIPNPSNPVNWATDSTNWANVPNNQKKTKFDIWNPFNTRGITPQHDDTKGYHAEYEFECFVESNGIANKPTLRTYLHWAQFGKTATGNITNTLTDCIVKGNFYGGGNFGNVNGTVTSTLQGNTVVEGCAFGAGYSGAIDSIRIHDKRATVFPKMDKAGVIDNGELFYLKNSDNTDRYYTWCYKNSSGQVVINGVAIPTSEIDGATVTYNNPTFEYPVGSNHWYVLTNIVLENLGTVSGNVTLTLKDSAKVGTLLNEGQANQSLKEGTGNVFGGGNESAVTGNTKVNLQQGTTVLGNVYGGGNIAPVSGDSEVKIQNPEP